MAPEPQHRQSLARLLESLRETTAQVVQEEINDRKSIHPDASPPLSVLDARIFNLRRDDDMLEAAKSFIQVQRTTLERQKARAHNAAQPCCRIPDEVLSHIFEVGVPAPSEQWSYNPCESEATRWTLEEHRLKLKSVGATCGRFRATLLNTPRCWTYVTHTIGDYPTYPSKNQKRTALDETSTVFARSKGYRFNLELTLGPRLLPPAYSMKTISSILSPHMHRCEQLLLTCEGDVANSLLLILPSPLSTSLRSVRHLSFEWREAENDDAEQQNMSRCAMSLVTAIQAPLLSLSLDILACQSHHVAQSFRDIQAHALTRLRLSTQLTPSENVRLLSRCTSLEHLRLTICSSAGQPPLAVTLNKLVSLRDESECGSCIQLIAPRLEQVELHENHAFILLDPSLPTLPSLRRFYLATKLDLDEEWLASFFHRHQHIVEVELCCTEHAEGAAVKLCAAVEAFRTRLADTNSRLSQFPTLGHLYLTGHRDFAEDKRVAASLAFLLRGVVGLHVRLGDLWNTPAIMQIIEQFPARVTIQQSMRSDTWRTAWGRWAF